MESSVRFCVRDFLISNCLGVPALKKKSITFSTHSRQKIKMTNRGAWIPIGVAIGVAISVATKDPVWIAVGVALGAGLGFTRPQKDCRPDKED